MADFKQLHIELIRQLNQNQFNIDDDVISKKLIEYVLLLHKWNQVHNLTSIREPLQMISKHIL